MAINGNDNHAPIFPTPTNIFSSLELIFNKVFDNLGYYLISHDDMFIIFP